MADDAPCALLCLISAFSGKSLLLRVKPTSNMDMIDLKALIKKNGVLSSVGALDLTFVRMTLANDSTTNSPVG
jgi:hypothetical protein